MIKDKGSVTYLLLVLMTAEDRVVHQRRLLFLSPSCTEIDLTWLLCFTFCSLSWHIINYIFIFLSPVFKLFKVLEFYSSVGKDFQIETARLLKKFFLMAYAVLLVGLTTFSPTNVNQVEKSTLSIPRRILNTWTMSNFLRLSTRVQRFSSLSFF